jgi:signal transduction histidine kinase
MSLEVTRVLVVEDESIVALDLQSLLTRLGYEVCGREATGEAAVTRARQEEPDLILMDIRLAGEMDGISSAEAIRRELDVPVIFLTAYADRQTVERAKSSDAYAYLLKPFQEREIEIAIDMAIYKHETQKRLRQQEALLEATVESIPDAVVTLDWEDRIVLINEAALDLLGEGRQELLGKPFREAVPLKEVESEQPGKGALGSRVRLPHGPLLELRRRRLEEAEGGSAAVVVLRDISLQAAYEEQTESARRAAEEASRAKSEFIANMSHELRTPMNSILGMSELAMGMAEREEQREYLSILRRSAEELQGLISNVLYFSRIEGGTSARAEGPFQLDELLTEICRRQMPRASRKGLYLTCDIRPETPLELLGERESVASILVNLISNGLKFTREGGVAVSAYPGEGTPPSAGAESPGEERGREEVAILLEVRDTGIGIPDEQRSRVFEPFTQVDPSATRYYGGTGIGLALVRKLAQRLGGEISIAGGPGEGTTVRLLLRLRRNPGSPEYLAQEIRGAPEVLFWEESDRQLNSLLPWLERWGVSVSSATTADSLVSRGGKSPGILIASAESISKEQKAYTEALEKEGVLGGILIGEVEELRTHPKVHLLGMPPRLRRLRSLLLTWPDNSETLEEREISSTLSVLVVDDEVLNRVATEKTLRSKGHEVRTARGGLEAIEELTENMAEVVLLDLEMPGMDGWETAERIRKEVPRGTDCAIIAMTGHSRESEGERAKIVGMDEFVTKPITDVELDRVIRATFSRKRYARRLQSEQVGEAASEESPNVYTGSNGEGATLLEGAKAALKAGQCERAEPLLVEYRGRCVDRREKDSVFKAVLACRRQDPEGALLRLEGIESGG